MPGFSVTSKHFHFISLFLDILFLNNSIPSIIASQPDRNKRVQQQQTRMEDFWQARELFRITRHTRIGLQPFLRKTMNQRYCNQTILFIMAKQVVKSNLIIMDGSPYWERKLMMIPCSYCNDPFVTCDVYV